MNLGLLVYVKCCKAFSKILATRLSHLLPNLISKNQVGFVKGRVISENIAWAQEIAQSLKKKTWGANVILQLDIAKTFVRVNWE